MIDSDHLIIYHNFAQRIVTFRVPSTTYHQKVKIANIKWPLSSSILLDTISLTKLLPSGEISPIPFTINTFDSADEMVTVVDSFGKVHMGKFQGMIDDWIELFSNQTNKIERIRDYKTVYSKNQPVLMTQPIETLTGTLIQISYMIKNIYWTPEYLAIINSSNIDMIMLLQLSANIKSIENIQPTKLTLISDGIDPPYSVQPQLISTHNHITLGSIPLLLAKRIYLYSLNQNMICYGYRFTPKISLPAGLIRFYHHDPLINGLGPFITDTCFKETKAHNQTEIIVGPTDQINGVIDGEYVKIWNWSEKDALIILRYEKKDSQIMMLALDPIIETNEYIDWEINIPITKEKEKPIKIRYQ